MQQAAPPAQEVLLAGNGLTQTFDGQRYQFRDIDVLLPRGAKQGLVGINGVGKSSLLKVLAGVDMPEAGSVQRTRGVRVAYVEQDPTLPEGSTAADFVYTADAPAMAAVREFNAAADATKSRGSASGAPMACVCRALGSSLAAAALNSQSAEIGAMKN